MRADADLVSWLTGARRAPGGRRVAVIEEPGSLMRLCGSGWVDADTRVFLRARDGNLAPAALRRVPLLCGYRGSFARPGSRIEFDDGYVLERTSYGDAEFRAIELPTEVRVWCPEDFSAFLRDADLAMATGDFPAYLTNPLTILADQPALAGSAQDAGTVADRLFVAAGGQVSASPSGPPVGRVEQEPADWIATAARLEAASPVPGTTALGGLIDDADRRDALAERPALARYLRAIRVQRAARARGRLISRISGFGGRFSPGLPRDTGADGEPTDHPMVVRAGSQLWIITGQRDDATPATLEQVGVLEAEACLPDARERLVWAFRQLGITAQRYRDLRSAVLPSASPERTATVATPYSQVPVARKAAPLAAGPVSVCHDAGTGS